MESTTISIYSTMTFACPAFLDALVSIGVAVVVVVTLLRSVSKDVSFGLAVVDRNAAFELVCYSIGSSVVNCLYHILINSVYLMSWSIL